ncbi:unnamed protein product, partial [Ectocarpus sp. 12 AP-2014]
SDPCRAYEARGAHGPESGYQRSHRVYPGGTVGSEAADHTHAREEPAYRGNPSRAGRSPSPSETGPEPEPAHRPHPGRARGGAQQPPIDVRRAEQAHRQRPRVLAGSFPAQVTGRCEQHAHRREGGRGGSQARPAPRVRHRLPSSRRTGRRRRRRRRRASGGNRRRAGNRPHRLIRIERTELRAAYCT